MATTPSRPFSRPVYVPAVGPRLRWVLRVLFVLLALMVANSCYLACVAVLEWTSGETYQNYFYLVTFLTHLGLGLLLLVPFVLFVALHLRAAWRTPNRRALRVGVVLLIVSVCVLGSGLALMRVGRFDLKSPPLREAVYWVHVLSPLVALWLYWLHRLVGPPIEWRVGLGYLAVVAGLVGAMVFLHTSDPRQWNVAGPAEGERYFFPSLARTATGNFIPARALTMDHYCAECHADAHAGWSGSVHRFSSFNNPAYLATVRETRAKLLKRDGNVQAARFCAGCHDPVPFFSGAFDDPQFDDVHHPTALAGVTCTSCHAITHVNSPRGNADYTIEEPLHYPFTYSDNRLLQFINRQLVKAKPTFHKRTFLKPLHKTSEFCGTCHKVHLPKELNEYRFLRGQNHYDSFLLSGVSGHGARSFYYPERAERNCNGCHMPLRESGDFGAKFFEEGKGLAIHDHLFPSANTALAYLRGEEEVVRAHQEFLRGVTRVDLFGLREGGRIDGELIAPLRPDVPVLEGGRSYLLETVIRTLKLGHHFTQGTADSNEIWLDVTVRDGARVIGRSGGMTPEGEVDRWAHFVNAFVLDRNGARIARRNAEDIFTPLYDHQIPPGAGQTVHYFFRIPEGAAGPITIDAKLQYRKFDREYTEFFLEALPEKSRDKLPDPVELPVTTLATDRITFSLTGRALPSRTQTRGVSAWERWNDYGIGLLLGGTSQLRQAAEAFAEVERLGRCDGPLNLARALHREGRLDEATEALQRAARCDDPPAPPWTLAWLSGLVNREQGHLETAVENLRAALHDDTQERRERGFDFSRDYVVGNLLGETLFDLARTVRGEERKQERDALLREAVERFEATLEIDPENVTAHYNLQLLQTQLGDAERAAEYAALHARYKVDDNARGQAIAKARARYPAADHAAESLVIYPLQRRGAPELPAAAAVGEVDEPDVDPEDDPDDEPRE